MLSVFAQTCYLHQKDRNLHMIQIVQILQVVHKGHKSIKSVGSTKSIKSIKSIKSTKSTIVGHAGAISPPSWSKPDGRTDASGCVHFVRPDASGRVRFGASGFLNGAKAAHHSLRIVRWWCKGPHRAISPPSNLDLVDFVDFVVQRHTPRGNFPRFLWTWGTCGLVHSGTLWLLFLSRWGKFLHRRARNRTPYGRVRLRPHFLRPDASGRARTRPASAVVRRLRTTHPKSRPVVQRHTPRLPRWCKAARTLRFCASGRVHLVRPDALVILGSGTFGGHAGAFFSTAVRESGPQMRRPAASCCFETVRTRPDA